MSHGATKHLVRGLVPRRPEPGGGTLSSPREAVLSFSRFNARSPWPGEGDRLIVTCAAVTPAGLPRSAPPHLGALCGPGPPRPRTKGAATPAVRPPGQAHRRPATPLSCGRVWRHPRPEVPRGGAERRQAEGSARGGARPGPAASPVSLPGPLWAQRQGCCLGAGHSSGTDWSTVLDSSDKSLVGTCHLRGRLLSRPPAPTEGAVRPFDNRWPFL